MTNEPTHPLFVAAALALTFFSLLVVILAYWNAKKQKLYRQAVSEFRWDPNMSPIAFERHCAEFLRLRGWSAQTTSASGDQGVDVTATKNKITVVIQCKKYSKPVGNKAVQEAHAGKAFAGAHVAAVVSNVSYTPSAHKLAERTGVLLLHFTDLARADELFLQAVKAK